jgi:hypothetical protein
MSRVSRLFVVLAFLMFAVAALALVVGEKPAQASPVQSTVAQACDPSGSVNGTAEPNTVRPGQTITFSVRGFTGGEEVSFWFTTPRGDVFGTARPLCCAPPGGAFRFEPLEIPQEFGQEPGRWAFTVQGNASRNTAVVYFCVVTQVQPTTTPVPPTATTAPPTATAVPPSPTVAASPTAQTSPTAAETATVLATSTVVVQTPSPQATNTVVVVSPTVANTPAPIQTATTGVMPTEVPPVPAPTTDPITPGMPRTGESDLMLLLLLAFAGMGALWIGFAARKSSRV